MDRSRVVVTGMGCVTPLGTTVAETWQGLSTGRNAIGPIERFDPRGFPTTFAAEIKSPVEPHLEGRLARWVDTKSRFAVAAAHEAMDDAGLSLGEVPATRIGVSMGAEVSRPDLGVLAERLKTLTDLSAKEALAQVSPKDYVVMSAFFPATALSHACRARGPNLTTSTACTSSAQSIADALRVLRRGDADVMLAGGTDRLVEELMVMGFGLLGALSTRNDEPHLACRPFDRTRDGFVLGEGAGVLVLERLEHALARGARVHAEVLGYGCSANAWRITDSPPDGRGARQSMREALDDAGVTPDQVDYINAHGTSTMQNDAGESAAIHAVFGERRVPVSSTKSMMGHLVAACGAVEFIACVKAIQTGTLPPTINYEFPDPSCDVDCVPNVPRAQTVDVALTNAFGFGGSNGSLVVGRYRP